MFNTDVTDPKSDYYQEKIEWLEEKYNHAIKQRRFGWAAFRIAGFIAILLAIALVLLIPLKQSVPYTIEVDKVTGETHVKKPLEKGKLTQSEALTKYWLIKYVRARLGYDRQDIEPQYEMVNMMSEKKEFARYAKAFDPRKPDSPYQVYGENTTVTVEVKSISFIDEDTASVRLNLIETNKDGRETPSPWIVTTSYQFTLEPRTEAERFENPLGFQATSWRLDAEVEQKNTKESK